MSQAFKTYKNDLNSNVLGFIQGSIKTINTNSLGQTSIERIFNGFGFMGGAIFLLPGVKGLIANGKNPDGTYKTIDYVSSKVVVRFDMSTNRNDLTVSVNPGGYLNYDSALKINSLISDTLV